MEQSWPSYHKHNTDKRAVVILKQQLAGQLRLANDDTPAPPMAPGNLWAQAGNAADRALALQIFLRILHHQCRDALLCVPLLKGQQDTSSLLNGLAGVHTSISHVFTTLKITANQHHRAPTKP
eukprot:1157594-Pelagomonas_calceolata.AAC.4